MLKIRLRHPTEIGQVAKGIEKYSVIRAVGAVNRSDIPLLVRRFIQEFARDFDAPFRGITTEAMQRLVAAPWPGNVRQLRNLVESMVVLAPGTEIRASDTPDLPVVVLTAFGDQPGAALPLQLWQPRSGCDPTDDPRAGIDQIPHAVDDDRHVV